jgi:hypothetical protein
MDFTVDFSPIGKLGQAFDDARTKAVRERALAELGNSDDPDAYARVGRALMASGDLAGGQSLAALGLKFADRKTAAEIAKEGSAYFGGTAGGPGAAGPPGVAPGIPAVTGAATTATAPVVAPRPPVGSTAKVWGDQEAIAAGLYDAPGDIAPASTPAVAGPAPFPRARPANLSAPVAPPATPDAAAAGPAATVAERSAPVLPQRPPSPKVAFLFRALQSPALNEGQRETYKLMLQTELAKEKETQDILEYEYAVRQGFKGGLEQWMQRKKGGAGEYGLQPIWGTKNGQPAIIQLGKGGDAVETKFPEGFQPGKDAIKVDAGTHTVLLDPVTRQVIGQVPKNIEQKESAEERGKAQGQAQVALPGVLSQSELALKTINQIRTHPGRNSWFSVGALGGAPPIPGTNQAGFIDLVEQAKGQTFLTAFERLKGAGAITEIEGAKATQAIARLNRKATDADFNMALQDLEEVIRKGVETARQKAAGAQSGQSAPGGSGWTDLTPGVRIREKR